MSRVGRSDDRFHDTQTSRSTRPNHFRWDVGRAVVRADLGGNVPKKILRTLPVATDNSKKTDLGYGVLMDGVLTLPPLTLSDFEATKKLQSKGVT